MPHNLYLHSALVKSRDIDKSNKKAVREANMYVFIEAAIALFVSLIINIFVVAVFAKGLWHKTEDDVRQLCIQANNSHSGVFDNTTNLVDADIYKVGLDFNQVDFVWL